jgi:hypothetical protein
MKSLMTVAWLWVMTVLVATTAAAQNVETDPLQCWWRTSAGAVRVGEPFTAVLTCAVVETPDVKVVVDESRLEPSVAQFAPFEVLGGSHAADLRTDARRFFQYEYRLRLIAENMFGKDAALPETRLTYRIQSRIAQRGAPAEAIAGREQTYILPPLSVRMLSLVPADASDIRDASAETFADVDRLAFRASLLSVIGGVLFALAGLVAVLTIVRIILQSRKPSTAAERLVGDGAILRGVGRELAAVQRERESSGWSADLAARALASLRIVATYALGRRAARTVVAPGPEALAPTAQPDGRMVVNVGWLRRKQVAVSGAATARSVASAITLSTNGRRPGELETIEEALSRFTIAQYGRPTNGSAPTFDDSALDESIRNAQQILRRLKLEQTWIMRRLRRNRPAAAVERRVWSH